MWGDELLKRTVWASDCRSWYKNGTKDGRISALYPGSILHFVSAFETTLLPSSLLTQQQKDLIENIRGEDFNITYNSKVSGTSLPVDSIALLTAPQNQWKFLGDGFTQLEVDNGDLGYYIKC